jgi:hypothetical protein
MIELESAANGRFLCVTYDTFDQPANFSVDQADLAYHLNQVCRLILLGVLLELDEDPSLTDRLSAQDRQLLKHQSERFLGSLTVQQFGDAMRSIKSLGDRSSELWKKYGGPLAAAIQALLIKAGLGDVRVPSELVSEARQDETLRYHFESLLRVAQQLGFESVYVLVDRVDETPHTNGNVDATFALIRALLTELSVLEASGVGFKFFLWNRIEAAYRTHGGRPDRVEILRLDWSIEELQEMLSARLRAFSKGRVNSLNDLLCGATALDLHLLVCLLAARSPRDVIRLSKTIVNEQTRTGTGADCLDDTAINLGIRRFADDRALELFPDSLNELKRIGRCNFTISYIASDVFRINNNSARAKVQQWLNAGSVQQIGGVPSGGGGRPTNLYAITDLRVAIAAMSATDVRVLIETFVLECPNCHSIQMCDDAQSICQSCGQGFAASDCRTLADVCARR